MNATVHGGFAKPNTTPPRCAAASAALRVRYRKGTPLLPVSIVRRRVKCRVKREPEPNDIQSGGITRGLRSRDSELQATRAGYVIKYDREGVII